MHREKASTAGNDNGTYSRGQAPEPLCGGVTYVRSAAPSEASSLHRPKTNGSRWPCGQCRSSVRLSPLFPFLSRVIAKEVAWFLMRVSPQGIGLL
jgi:hypothetical protein